MFQSEGFRKYFKNTSWLFIERIVRLGTVLAVGIVVARHLGPIEFGKLSYATGFVGLFFAFAAALFAVAAFWIHLRGGDLYQVVRRIRLRRWGIVIGVAMGLSWIYKIVQVLSSGAS